MEKICEVAWDQVRVSPFQPRRHFVEEELDELAASIDAVGLIHPPVVRPVMSGDKVLYYELIAGERRWRATQRAGMTHLKVLVRDYGDEQAAKSTLIENVQRVNLDPMEMAEAFKKLTLVFQMTQEEIADKVGKKRSTVANYLRLLSLPEAIRTSLSKGKITMGHAKAILSLDSHELQNKLNDLIISNQLNVRDAEKESRKLMKNRSMKSGFTSAKRDEHLDEVCEQLQEHFGTKVEIEPTRHQGGKITIHYYSLDDLDRVIALSSSMASPMTLIATQTCHKRAFLDLDA